MNQLFAPIKLAVGWGLYPRKLGFLAILMLVLLRLSVGWHFYSEGSSKLSSGKFTATPFLKAARGPFAENFHKMIWDWNGTIRLDQERTKGYWEWYRGQVAGHYAFDETQQKQADQVLARTLKQYQYVLDLNADDLTEIEFGRTRLADLNSRSERREVASLKGQKETIQREWRQKLDPILSDIDNAWDNLERDLNGVATAEQLQSRGLLYLPVPRDEPIDTTVVDKLIPWFDVFVGACLLLGLLTPVAALAAGAFLFSVFLSQYPPTSGPTSTYYQLIESMACCVLASTGAGRFAGLDAIIHAALNKSAVNQKG